MPFQNLTQDYLHVKHEVDLNYAVVNSIRVLERNLYSIIESTLDLISNYDNNEAYKNDDDVYSGLISQVNLNFKKMVPWETKEVNTGSFFFNAISVLSKHHHCRVCGKTIRGYKEYDLYFLSLLIEFEYLVKIQKYEEFYKKIILKYWFIKFKVCLECDYLLIERKYFAYLQDFNNKLGGYNEQSGNDTDWILGKIDYFNNLKTVLLHLVEPKKVSSSNLSKLHQYLKIMDEDIIYKLQLKLNLLKTEKTSEESFANKYVFADKNLNYHILLIENTLKRINNFLITQIRIKIPNQENLETVPKKESPIETYNKKLKESERKENFLAQEVELSNKLIIYKEQTLLLDEQLQNLIAKRQFKDIKNLRLNLELLNREIDLIEQDLKKLNENF
ncbi:hypothetical protein QEN19_000872 [Hanseniaspora menglaensis]